MGSSVRYCLIALRAKSHSVSYPARLAPFMVVKNGFNRSMKQEMNRPSVANRLVSCCTPFLVVGGWDSIMALS